MSSTVECCRPNAATRMLRLPQVIAITGLGRDSIYRLAAAGEFPRPRKLSQRASGWREDEIVSWLDSRPVAGASRLDPPPSSIGPDPRAARTPEQAYR